MNRSCELYLKLSRMRPKPGWCIAILEATKAKNAGFPIVDIWGGKILHSGRECKPLQWDDVGNHSVWRLPIHATYVLILQGIRVEIIKENPEKGES